MKKKILEGSKGKHINVYACFFSSNINLYLEHVNVESRNFLVPKL